jgi:hypothetical protein
MGALKNQTAVEWLAQWLHDNPVVYQKDYYAAIEKAKALEKDQIIDSFNYARYRLGDSSDYYNETYGGDK